MTPQLTVYKASAGSGKTFRLAIEFIKLLMENPSQYRSILAVTFTNKATEEMKMRILSQLYGIAHGLDDSDSYIHHITEELGITRERAAHQAQTALTMIVHDYSQLRVMTIDTFFQSVLRNLARELELTANLRIGLNDNQVEEQAVDQMIEELTLKDKMLNWIISYIEQNMEDDKSWNVIGQIKHFGRTIFRDYYKESSSQLNKQLEKKGFFSHYEGELKRIRSEAKDRMASYAAQFESVLSANGLSPKDLKNGTRGIGSYFNKLAGNDWSEGRCCNDTMKKCCESAEEWASKTSKVRATILSIAQSQLIPLLKQAESDRPQQWRLFVSADVTLRHLNQLRLLSHIEQKVRMLNDEANRFLLSDTQPLLHQLIDHQDSPFIFEKIGTQLTHIMIDEFQDTSTVQWKNFKVLLEETMSHASAIQDAPVVTKLEAGQSAKKPPINNLIVGDVKQSIYRWRSGDWTLLNNIQQEFAHAGGRLDVQPLDENWRSARNIIYFNNAFFELAKAKEMENERAIIPELAEQLAEAYKDVGQKETIKTPADGLVSIRLLPSEDYNEATLDLIGQHVDELLQHGVSQKNICILVRTNKYIPVIADYFMQTRPSVSIVSDEAFRLDASLAVNAMVNALRVVVHPNDIISRENVERAQRSMAGDAEMADISQRPELKEMPLMDLVELLFRELHADRIAGESGYVCLFFDQVAAYIRDNGADIEGFLKAWDEELCKKTIQSNQLEGIRLISIHKSKGLEFDNVIIPWCDWRLEMVDTIWCKPTESPFNELPIVPIDYSAKLAESIYRDDYAHEHLQTCVDNLNLLYVAFTRPKLNLFVVGRKNTSGQRSKLIEDCLVELAAKLPTATLDMSDDKTLPTTFEYGTLALPSKKEEKASQNIFLQPVEPCQIGIAAHASKAQFRQSNESREFIVEMTDEADSSAVDTELPAMLKPSRQEYVKMGNIMHRIFSQIHTTDDIPDMLRRLEQDGVLYDESISREKVEGILKSRFSNQQVRDWFSDRWQLFNECSIIAIDREGKLMKRRPDRVMFDGEEVVVVDFKFGSEQRSYHQQVERYKQLLSDMGYTRVSGYLWYVYQNHIVEV